MERFYKRCIFCFGELPAKPPQDGEHIIPKYLMGSMRVKDVCPSCNSKFGSEVDPLASEDSLLVRTILKLDLPDLKQKLAERTTTTTRMIDADDGSVCRVKVRNGRLRMPPVSLELGGQKADKVAMFQKLRGECSKSPPNGLTAEKTRSIIDEIEDAYDRLSPGESITVPVLGRTIRKARGTLRHSLKVTPGASHRLIAKIAHETLFLLSDPRRKLALMGDMLDPVRRYVLGQGPEPQCLILHPPWFSRDRFRPSKASYYHRLWLWHEGWGAVVDMRFFGATDYRVVFSPRDGMACGPLRTPHGDFKGVGVSMTFEPNRPRGKFVGMWRVGADRDEWHEVPRL